MVNVEHNRCDDLVQIVPRDQHGFEIFDTHTPLFKSNQINQQEKASACVINEASKNTCVPHVMRPLSENMRIQETRVQSLYYTAAKARLLSLLHHVLLGEKKTLQEPLDRIVETNDINARWEEWSPRKMLGMQMAAGTEGRGHASCTLALLSSGNTFDYL